MFTFIYDTYIVYIVVVGADFKMDINLWKKCTKELQNLISPNISSIWITIAPKYPDPTSINLMMTGKGIGIKTRHFQIKKKI